MFKIKQNSSFFEEKASFIDLIRFMRPETSLFITGMAISGFLFFNSISPTMIFLFFAVFFLSAAGYAINYMTDKKEDLVNNSTLNAFTSDKKGYFIVFLLMLISFIFSLFLSPNSLAIYLASVPLVPAYSLLRIKKIFLLKNIYVGLMMALMSLVGAAAAGFSVGVLLFLLFPFLFGFSINLLGDIRGYEGDKSAGIRTIPVLFSNGTAKRVLYSAFALFFILALATNYSIFFFLMPFVLLAAYFLMKNDLKRTRIFVLLSFMFLPFALFAIKSGWWLFAS